MLNGEHQHKDNHLLNILRTLGCVRVSGIDNLLIFVIIGTISLIVIVGIIMYLIMRKRKIYEEEEDKKNIEQIDNVKQVNPEENNPYYDNKNIDDNINHDNNEEKNHYEGEDEIKVEPKPLANNNPDSTIMSIDRSKNNLLGNLNPSNGGPDENLSEPTSLKHSKRQVTENKNFQEDAPNKVSENSNVSNLSAHKIVLRNNVKDLLCYTNERRSEPDEDLFNDQILNAIKKEKENAENESKSITSSFVSESEKENQSNQSNPTPIVVDIIQEEEIKKDPIKQSGLVSTQFDIKQNRIITDFDENTKDVMSFHVFKQNELIPDTKIKIKDKKINRNNQT